jgi:tetratricopeptide (TPR) repeat protein
MSTMSVFVSHSHHDDDFCRGLVAALRGAGADVWYDEQNLGAGHLMDAIERELRHRPVFIVILSPTALASRWVKDESTWAYNRFRKDPTRILLPVVASALADEDDIWLFLQEFKRVELPGCVPLPLEEAIGETLRALALGAPTAVTGAEVGPAAPLPHQQDSAAELLARGKALQAQRRHREALPLFERVTQLEPRSFEAWANVARAHAELGEAAPALEAAERALQLEPASAMAWSAKAWALQFLQRYKEALAAAERALALDADDAIIWTDKGHTLDGLKRYAEALAAHEQALALDPQYSYAWGGKGDALYFLKRYAEALTAYEQALALDPKFAYAWSGKGNALYSLNRPAEALTAYEQALALDPKLAYAWSGKGNVLLNLNRPAEALTAYEQALALDPKNTFAWSGKGYVLRALGRTQEAKQAEAQAKAFGG